MRNGCCGERRRENFLDGRGMGQRGGRNKNQNPCRGNGEGFGRGNGRGKGVNRKAQAVQ